MIDACETLPAAIAAYTQAFRIGDAAATLARVQPSTVVYAMEDGEVVGQTRLAWKGAPAQPAPDLTTQVVAASVADWQARHAVRSRMSYPSKQTVVARAEEGRSTLGAATWTFKSASGATYADRAILLRTREGWRMLALLWGRED
uniref:hypothetical protein n=1 Tax=uncultured Caulobacter sp. TaxID=158749 RepID=UPI0026012901|nr:hypothetical protein [uncultured Caulobacter sp.]